MATMPLAPAANEANRGATRAGGAGKSTRAHSARVRCSRKCTIRRLPLANAGLLPAGLAGFLRIGFRAFRHRVQLSGQIPPRPLATRAGHPIYTEVIQLHAMLGGEDRAASSAFDREADKFRHGF